MSSIPHEGAHRQLLSCEIEKEMEKMGLESSIFYSVGGARYFSQLTGVAKEADSAYVPLLRQKQWPTLIIESGMPDSVAFTA